MSKKPKLCVENRLIKARVALLIDQPFYGTLALYLKLREANWQPTFATDGKEILYNKEFAEKLSDEEIKGVITHELLHCCLNHLTRIGEREYYKWAVAIDFATNAILKKDNFQLPNGTLYDSKFDNMSSEEIYAKLPNPKKGRMKGRMFGQGTMVVEIDEKGNVKSVTIDGKKYKPFDGHKQIKGSKKQIKEMEQEWKVNVTKAYHQAKMKGQVPAGISHIIEDLLHPKLDWKSLLRQFILEHYKDDFTFAPPNKKQMARGWIMPSLKDEGIGTIAVGVDSSGSISDEELKEFMSEIQGMLDSYSMTLHMFVCDAKVHDYYVFNHKDDLGTTPIKIHGRGGTDFRPVFRRIDEEFIQPKVLIYLTDLYGDFPSEAPDYPVLWVVTKDGDELSKVPWGESVKME